MNNDSKIISLITEVPKTIIEHFKANKQRLLDKNQIFETELNTFHYLVDSLCEMGNQFERITIEMNERFQIKLKEEVKDEKLGQLYQLTINSVLHLTSELQQQFIGFRAYKEKLHDKLDEFKDLILLTNEEIDDKEEDLEHCFKKNEKITLEQSEFYAANRHIYFSKDSQQVKDKISALDVERKKSEEELIHNTRLVLKNVDNNLTQLCESENKIKNDIRDYMAIMIKKIRKGNEDEVDKCLGQSDKSVESFQKYILPVKRGLNLRFSSFVDTYSYEKSFNFEQLREMNIMMNNSFYENVYKKRKELEPSIKKREKIFTEIMIKNLYTLDEPIDEHSVKKLSLFFTKQNAISYFTYNMLFKKCELLIEKPFEIITVPMNSFNNFKHVIDLILQMSLSNETLDYESLYYLIRFGLVTFNSSYENLLENNIDNVLFNRVDFWVDLFYYFKQNMNPKQLENSEIIQVYNEEQPQKVRRFPSLFSRSNSNKDKKPEKIISPAFDNILYLTLKCGLDFKVISQILLKIVPMFDIPVDLVKSLVKKKIGPLLASVSALESFRNISKYKNSKVNKQEKNQRLYLVIKLCSAFLSPKDLDKVMLLNRFINEKRKKIINWILFTQLNIEPEFRRKIYSINITPLMRDRQLLKDIHKGDLNELIRLDMMRTTCEDDKEDPKVIELILNNLCSPQGINFSYYQGLNFITRYFYMVFKKDSQLTYRVVGSMLENKFVRYFDDEFKNLKKLFFSLKTIIKMRLPLLYNYLVAVRKIDLEIIFTSWCLTIFTHINIFQIKNDHLDQIMDIFISKSWPGLFRVILVILEELESKLYSSNYDQILMLFSSITKDGFSKLSSSEADKDIFKFNFKQRIKRFKNVNNRLLDALNTEYSHTLKRIKKIFDKLEKPTKTSDK